MGDSYIITLFSFSFPHVHIAFFLHSMVYSPRSGAGNCVQPYSPARLCDAHDLPLLHYDIAQHDCALGNTCAGVCVGLRGRFVQQHARYVFFSPAPYSLATPRGTYRFCSHRAWRWCISSVSAHHGVGRLYALHRGDESASRDDFLHHRNL